MIMTSGSEKDKTAKKAVAKPMTASKAVSEEPAAEESSEEPEAAPVEEEEKPKPQPAAASAAPSASAKKSSGAEKDDANFLPDIPSYAPYLIVGGGTAAMSAFKAIRAKDAKAKVNEKQNKTKNIIL